MIFDNLNIVMLLVGAVFGFWETLQLNLGKKIVKSANQITIIIYFLAVFFAVSIFTSNLYILIFTAVTLLISYVVTKYIFGTSYRVQTHDKQKLIELVKSSLREIDGSVPEMVYGDDTIYFKTETGKTIEIKDSKSILTSRINYYIKLKRWMYYDPKRDTLSFIMDGLRDDDYRRSKISSITQIAFGIIMVVFTLFIVSYGTLQNIDVNPLNNQDHSGVVHLKDGSHYDNDEFIGSLQNILKNGFAMKVREVPSSLDTATIRLICNDKQNIVYFYNSKNVYIFAHYSSLIEPSTWQFFSWKIYNIFSNKEGVYFKVFLPIENEIELMKLLSTIN